MTVTVTVAVTVVVMWLLEYLEEAFARLWIKVQRQLLWLWLCVAVVVV